MLRARGVTHGYGPDAQAVRGADLVAAPGEVLALVGPNGAGKSTLLGLLEGRLTPGEGTIEAPPRRGEDGRVAFGYAPESSVHYEVLTGRENAVFFARAAGLPRAEAEGEVSAFLGIMGLAEDADRPVVEYSYGARRKLTLIEALAHRPAVALLDEPTVGLDADSRSALTGVVRERARAGLTTVLASHDLSFVGEVADRVLFMHRGRVLGGGRPEALVAEGGGAARFEVTLGGASVDAIPWPDGLRVLRAGNPLVLESSRGPGDVTRVVTTLITAGGAITSLTVREAGLADAFRRIAGDELGPDPRLTGGGDT